jgi:hypothetical protein
MATRPSLTKILAEASFYQASLANIPGSKQDFETYQRIYERFFIRFEKMSALALSTVDRAAT